MLVVVHDNSDFIVGMKLSDQRIEPKSQMGRADVLRRQCPADIFRYFVSRSATHPPLHDVAR